MVNRLYLTAREAAAELNVSRATLYAYVSRGLVSSEPSENGRSRLYRAEDIRKMRARKTPHQAQDSIARHSLSFGAPVLDSAITLIADGSVYYRGRDAIELARKARFEQVAALLWQQDGADPFDQPLLDIDLPTGLAPVPRAISLLSIAGERDLKGLNLSARGIAETGARIVRLLVSGFSGHPLSADPVHSQLAQAWHLNDVGADLIRMALILVADHELNTSAFTVRCIASTRATPYAAITGGICALQGPRHGGLTSQVLAFLNETVGAADPADAVMARLKRGETIPGFGHLLYDGIDPRAAALLAAMERTLGDSPSVEIARKIVCAAKEALGLGPNIDFALATLARALSLPDESSFSVFAIGRSAGWIAHAQEQYRLPELIRPRARYVGEEPQPATALD